MLWWFGFHRKSALGGKVIALASSVSALLCNAVPVQGGGLKEHSREASTHSLQKHAKRLKHEPAFFGPNPRLTMWALTPPAPFVGTPLTKGAGDVQQLSSSAWGAVFGSHPVRSQ